MVKGRSDLRPKWKKAEVTGSDGFIRQSGGRGFSLGGGGGGRGWIQILKN